MHILIVSSCLHLEDVCLGLGTLRALHPVGDGDDTVVCLHTQYYASFIGYVIGIIHIYLTDHKLLHLNLFRLTLR